MIKVKDLDAQCQAWVNAIADLKGYAMVVEDQHASKKLQDRLGVQLLCVYPTNKSEGRTGMVTDADSLMLWVIEKGWTDKTETEELDQYEKTQDIILQIREGIKESQENGCGIFWRLEPSSITIEPEFNAFGGWNGWVMQFMF